MFCHTKHAESCPACCAPESSLLRAPQVRAAGVCTTSPACMASLRACPPRSLHGCSLRALRRHGPAHSLLAQTARAMAAGRLRAGAQALHVSAAAAVEAKEETFTYQAEVCVSCMALPVPPHLAGPQTALSSGLECSSFVSPPLSSCILPRW